MVPSPAHFSSAAVESATQDAVNALPAACVAGGPQSAALAAAFAAFTDVSRQLEESYRTLEREAARLRRQLRGAHERRAAESRRNAELAQQLSALLEALPGGVLLLDGDGRIGQANAAASALLGEPLVGEYWTSLRQRAFAGTQGDAGDLELRDGRRVDVAQRPLQPGPGRVLLLTDITGKRKIEDLLSRHRRLAALGEMAAALAHQIRTPLAAGLLYATNASRPDLPGAQRDELLARAVTCLHDLERLIGDMLQFARGATLHQNCFSLGDLLTSVENSLRPIVTPEQTLTVACRSPGVALSGNREALAGALLNLATNALHAAGQDGNVQIQARASALQAEILVVDSGPGIPAALRERIFEPFFTSRPDGTGLGLSVARSIARAHRGDVALADGRAGGTAFALHLPVATPATGEAGPERNEAA